MGWKNSVYIAGAGNFGQIVMELLEEYGKEEWHVRGFLDNNKAKQGNDIKGLPVLNPCRDLFSDSAENVYVFIAVIDWRVRSELAEQLYSYGLERIYYVGEDVYWQKARFFEGSKLIPRYATKAKPASDGKLEPVFRYIETHVMDGCNLKCKGCTHFSNLFPTDAAVPLEQFERDIKRLKEICDVKKLRLLGGEPLLHRELLKFMKIARGAFPYSDVRVVTNGLLIDRQDEELLSYMREHEIFFDISWYPPMLQRKEEILSFLDNRRIKYHAFETEIYEFSRCLTLSDIHDPEISQLKCGSRYCTILRDGKLYKCALAAYLPEYRRAFGVNIREEPGMDIYHDSIDKIRDFSVACVKDPIDMCRYCTEQPESFSWGARPHPEKEDWLVSNVE